MTATPTPDDGALAACPFCGVKPIKRDTLGVITWEHGYPENQEGWRCPVIGWRTARIEDLKHWNTRSPAPVSGEAGKLKWTPQSLPAQDCPYNHTTAQTPFGRFLLTWKGWKDDPGYGFDETPWGEVEYHGWNSVEEAQKWAEEEMMRRIRQHCAGAGRSN